MPAIVAGVNSMTFVESENDTVADPFCPLTSIVVPDTDAIDPLTSSSPLIFTGAWDGSTAAVVVDAVEDALGDLVVAELQATADNAVIPIIANVK
ncbi:MAG: hypothetical protein ACR2JI_16835 [Mycobacterium sp.]